MDNQNPGFVLQERKVSEQFDIYFREYWGATVFHTLHDACPKERVANGVGFADSFYPFEE
jgi:hypothetical protein